VATDQGITRYVAIAAQISAQETTRSEREAYEDDMRTEYNLQSLRVRKLGSARKSFGAEIVRLEPDVAIMFPNANAVNEALRFLIRVMNNNQALAPTIAEKTRRDNDNLAPNLSLPTDRVREDTGD